MTIVEGCEKRYVLQWFGAVDVSKPPFCPAFDLVRRDFDIATTCDLEPIAPCTG